MKYPAKGIYQGDLASSYERSRTATPLGRLVWRREFALLKEFAQALMKRNATILDAPTGTGRFLPLLRQLGHIVIGIDISSDMLRVAHNQLDRRDVSLVLGDCESLPFEDQAFDYVLSMRYLGHLPPEARIRVLQEFKRVSKRGLIVGFPVLNPFTACKFMLGNLRYKLRKGEKRPWWPATTASLAEELAQGGLRLSEKKWLLGPFSQVAVLYLTPLELP